ncbi:hypothetical protein [Wenjunlia tyrosinilytica]|jgi:hypothetical protein|uniref:Uncharacterized protein n=1 Tax=Wenjunlia tyrosinilytica TaxID=1544741 RepID=A0A918DWI3_9ACTN|nr:hypothetical protein [Wenjunlia tyrosinilytica]GGO85754.1 hypothetical protein GCM10012280_20270 [Wenjunlia tyrosinilytica]
MNTHVPTPTHSKQVPMTTTLDGRSAALDHAPHQNRSLEMQLMPEALARAQMEQRLREAESERKALRLLRARRLQRRAERASLRARRALAVALMQ